MINFRLLLTFNILHNFQWLAFLWVGLSLDVLYMFGDDDDTLLWQVHAISLRLIILSNDDSRLATYTQ